jgi:CRISPR-associated protein Cas1
MVAQGDGARMRVPLEALQTVVLACNAQITSEAMAACVRHHVGVTSVRRNGAIRFALRGGISGNVHLRVAQVRAADDPDRVSQIARWLVAGKLQNLRLMLQRWSWDADTPTKRALRRIARMIEDRVAALAAAGDTNAIRGYEGDGTRIYFRGLRLHLAASGSALMFDRRNRRPPRDWSRSGLTPRSGSFTASVLDGPRWPSTWSRNSGQPWLTALLSALLRAGC